jgi:hypothetical protein
VQDLSARAVPLVTALPTPSAVLAGATVMMAEGNKPHWCDGVKWASLQVGNGLGWWNPAGGSATAPGVHGVVMADVTIGDSIARNVAATSMATRMRRIQFTDFGNAGRCAGSYGAAQYTLGVSGSPSYGGFFYQCRFVPADAATVSGARMFIGVFASSVDPTNVEPSTLTNCIGVAQLSSSNNLHIVYGGSAAQTAIDLGADFPAGTLSADAYELTLSCAPGVNNEVNYRVERLNTGHIATGTLTAATPGTQLPANTTFLAHRAWRTNNATALAVGIDIGNLYIETPY